MLFLRYFLQKKYETFGFLLYRQFIIRKYVLYILKSSRFYFNLYQPDLCDALFFNLFEFITEKSEFKPAFSIGNLNFLEAVRLFS